MECRVCLCRVPSRMFIDGWKYSSVGQSPNSHSQLAVGNARLHSIGSIHCTVESSSFRHGRYDRGWLTLVWFDSSFAPAGIDSSSQSKRFSSLGEKNLEEVRWGLGIAIRIIGITIDLDRRKGNETLRRKRGERRAGQLSCRVQGPRILRYRQPLLSASVPVDESILEGSVLK